MYGFARGFAGVAMIALSQAATSIARADEDDDDKKAAAAPAFAKVPDDDVFGFTSPTGLGDTGDINFTNENDFRFGKRGGRYFGLNNKFEFSYTIDPNWWVAASPFLAFNSLANVPGFLDKNTAAFDGLSVELAHRFVERSVSNPWQVTASIEPRWGRIDPESGFGSESAGFTAKVFVDKVLIDNTLFWAANLNWGPQWSKDPFMPNNTLLSSQTLVSTAVSWQFAPQLYLALEAQYFGAFARIAPDHLMGQAVFVGPALAWKVNEKTAFNIVWEPQVWGRSSTSPGLPLDLDNFERSTFRIKYSQQF